MTKKHMNKLSKKKRTNKLSKKKRTYKRKSSKRKNIKRNKTLKKKSFRRKNNILKKKKLKKMRGGDCSRGWGIQPDPNCRITLDDLRGLKNWSIKKVDNDESETKEELIANAETTGITDRRELRDTAKGIEFKLKINKANAKSMGIPLVIYTDDYDFYGYDRDGKLIDISGKNLFMVVDFAICICDDGSEKARDTYLVKKLHSDKADVPDSLFIVASNTDTSTYYTFPRWVRTGFIHEQMMDVLSNSHIVLLDYEDIENINIEIVAEYKNKTNTSGEHEYEYDPNNPDKNTTMYVVNGGQIDIPFGAKLMATMKARNMIKVADGSNQGEVYKVSYDGREGWVKAKNVKID